MREQVGTRVGCRRRGRWARRVIGAGAVAVVGLVGIPGTAVAAPVNPSDAQISAAEQAKADAATRIGEITAQLAEAQAAADAASAASHIALEDYEEKQEAYDAARATADAAAAAAVQAAADLSQGRADVATFARESYIQGSTASGTVALLSADGPGQLIERAALLNAAGEHRTDVVAQLTVLQEQAAAADEAARTAVAQADTLKSEAETLLAAAQAQEIAARGQADALAAQQVSVQAELEQAQQTLYGLEGARAAAEAYAQQQAAAAAAAAAAQRAAATSSGPSSSGSSSARPSAGSSGSSSGGSASGGSASGGSSSGGSSSGGSSSGSSASGGGTTASAPSGSVVQTAIAAAKSQLGLPYSWGGGGSSGPSYGISPDTGIWGFDCSGLTQYAYARAGVSIGGTSREQWNRFSGNTVAKSDLQAGDLVFWATGSSYTSIYHVALYIGGGQVVQAPQSGDVVKISNMWYGADYFGAVRPTG